jgi:hypothetical protein
MAKRNTLSGAHELNSYLGEKFMAKGYLLKLSQKGKWQKRFFIIKGPFLMYWANKAKSEKRKRPTDPITMECTVPDAAIDLRCMVACELDSQISVLQMESSSGRQFKLKPSSLGDKKHMPNWYHACKTLIEKSKVSTPEKESGTTKKRESVLVFNEGEGAMQADDGQSISEASDNGDEFEIASDLKASNAISMMDPNEEPAADEEVTIHFRGPAQAGPPMEPVRAYSSDLSGSDFRSPPAPPSQKREQKKTPTCSLFGACM